MDAKDKKIVNLFETGVDSGDETPIVNFRYEVTL